MSFDSKHAFRTTTTTTATTTTTTRPKFEKETCHATVTMPILMLVCHPKAGT